MYPYFVNFKHAQIAHVEQRIGAQFNVIGAGCGIGDDTVAEHRTQAVAGEYGLYFFVKDSDSIGRVNGFGFLVQEIQLQQLRQGFFHHAAQIGNSRIADMKNVLG